MVEEGTIPSEETPFANGPSLRDKQPKWIFHNVGVLLQPLEFVPALRGRVVPTEWQVRSVLGDCISKTTLIYFRAPQHRQLTLISDFRTGSCKIECEKGSNIGHEL